MYKPVETAVPTTWRIVPDDGMSMQLHPPYRHPEGSCIKKEVYLLTHGQNSFGGQMQRGVYDGFIGSDLRMHVLVSARDEVLNKWELSEGRP